MAAGDVQRGNIACTGQVAGTGAAIHVWCGFRPTVVMVFDITQLAKLTWCKTMGAGCGMLEVTAGTISSLGSGGITSEIDGFAIGTEANINTSGDTIHWIAFKD